MKKKIAILGSTGSIGKSLLEIIDKDKKNYEIILLTANKNYKKLINQAKKHKVKNIIIINKNSFRKACNYNKTNKIKIFNSFNKLNLIFKKKLDYVMSSIVGLDGLKPTINIIKHTKKIAIANKESIICGWSLIKRELNKYKTDFVPVDSEHFSIWFGLQNFSNQNIEKIYITASGGSLYKTPLKNFNKLNINQVLKHPNWSMGKKISTDSATMINKIYEVIEARNIFNIPYKKIEILIHPKSYIHGLIKFNNGLIKIIAHDTTMKIPIFNTISSKNNKKLKSKVINFNVLNNLNFNKVDLKRFPMVKLLKHLPTKTSLFETVIVSANDKLVDLYLKNIIKFTDIQKELFKIIKFKEFKKYKKKTPKNIDEIKKLNDYVHLKILKKVYKTSDVSKYN